MILFVTTAVTLLLGCSAPRAESAPPMITTPSIMESESGAETLPSVPEPIIIEIEVEKELAQSIYPQQFPMARNEVLKHINKCKERLVAANDMLQGAMVLGYEEEHPVVLLAKAEIEQIQKDLDFYEACWQECAAEYPVASEVWRFFIEECGYPEVVVAGLLGNMMVECGGYTLDLQWWIYNSTNHYGLVQWSPKYYAQMQGAPLRAQLEYLQVSIPEVFNGWSGKREGCLFNDFLAIENCRDVAYIFAVVYEKPGSIGEGRSRLADVALSYFCDPIQ